VPSRESQVDGTAEREYGGAGLGLALVRRLLEVMGREVRVESVEAKGSTFAVTLPSRRSGEAAGGRGKRRGCEIS